MALESTNPYTGEALERIEPPTPAAVERALDAAMDRAADWAVASPAERGDLLRRVARLLRERRTDLARSITLEMGKLIGEAEAEIDKCALVCDYYAEHAFTDGFLADEPVASDASRSLIAYEPLGPLLAVMPWNFPFWQVFRCAAPAVAAGNTVLLKHASNVPRCALTIAALWRDAGAPAGLFQTLLIDARTAEQIIADPRVRAVSLTGSEQAGRRVAAIAGEHLKKVVLELGGSDAFVVLEDADLDRAAAVAAQSRFVNAGQSCIAAKRFVVVEAIADGFVARVRCATEALRPGDPLDRHTTLAPLARRDLRDKIHDQVRDSINGGASLLCGGEPLERNGWFYGPTLLDAVRPGMPAHDEEVFGPVAAIVRVADEAAALRVANDSRFGLGGGVWTADITRGEAFARRMACGAAFVNGLVKSDPRLPFGGIKASGFGRELGALGIREFVNAKTLWVA
jgi:succinate-semialdehyde dehydrogenase/glutarate-semialdehyde dehydrogenase